jgi:ATP-dependent helicase/nuclease subunit A
MKLTDSQRAAIDYRGSNLLVAASAGSGKTEVLARRCVALIADPAQPCDVERLLVVTFTRAAAAELRVRIARMLREAAEQSAAAGPRAHLRRQELLVETADIGTIDAWCGRIVR